MNEFWECHIEKVSSDGSKARGGNCDTRLEKKPPDKQSRRLLFTLFLFSHKHADFNGTWRKITCNRI